MAGLLSSLIVAFLLALVASSGTNAAVGTTYTVDSTGDAADANLGDGLCADATGSCTLRAAIAQSNATAGFKDTIAFDIEGAGPHVISSPALPAVRDAVVIDGETQLGPTGTPLVEIEITGPLSLEIRHDSGASEIRGLAIHGGPTSLFVIDLGKPGGHVVERNFIGTDASGTVALGRGSGIGVRVDSPGNTIADNVIVGKLSGSRIQLAFSSDNRIVRNKIGTDHSGEVGLSEGGGTGIHVEGGSRNLLLGNVVSAENLGIWISGSTGAPSSDNRIEGNKIGTDIDGTDPLPNGTGVFITGLTSRNVVGGPDPAARNVISGNLGVGVHISDDASDTTVQGNLIGTDATGTLELGNGSGVGANGSNLLIAGNVVSGNRSSGIHAGGSSVRIEDNRIGTNKSGTEAIANEGFGLFFFNVVGESSAQRNVISGNLGGGVSVSGSGVEVLNNHIGTNLAGDVDLGNGGDGVVVGGLGTRVGKPGAGNLISGNVGAGLLLGGDRALVQANLIGTNKRGTGALRNDGAGVLSTCCHRDSSIGGAVDGEGNLISGNGGWGIQLRAAGLGTHLIQGNRIGTDVDGATSIPNAAGGVDIENPNNAFDIVSNVISGNGGDGVHVESVGAGSSRVVGNLIGTDASGESDLGNTGNGLRLGRAFFGGKIVAGGTAPGDRNVVSGNGENGLLVEHEGNEIVGNYVGTDVDGTDPLPNDGSGLRVQDAPNVVDDNVFSGNRRDGIEIVTNAQEVFGNLVGTGADGVSALGNARHGVSIEGTGFSGNNAVGGPDAGDGNTIAFNGEHGVFIRRIHINRVEQNTIVSNGGDGVAVVAAIRNTISENSIFSNGDLGIDLEDNGVTENDPVPDGDSGANLRQNFPVNLEVSADRKTVTGTLRSRPNATYRIEVFGNSAGVACDPSGSGEGERFLKAKEVPIDASGSASFSVPLDSALAGGDFVTATATDLTGASPGNTSEFSQCVVPPSGTIIVRKVTVPSPDLTDTSVVFTAGGGLSPAGFSLKNGESRMFDNLIPKAGYSLAETTPAGWDLTSACSDGSPISNIDVAPGETVTCTFTNRRRGTIIVRKVTVPSPDLTDTSFVFTAGGGLSPAGFSLKNGESRMFDNLIPKAGYSLAETTPAGWDLTSACSDGSPISNIDVAPGETVTCTFTNTKRGMVDVLKLTNGVPRPDLDIRFTLYRDGGTPGDLTGSDTQLEELSTLGDADGLLQFLTKLVPGTLYTICEDPVPAGWTSMWMIEFQVGGQIVTPYNPNANDTPPEDVGIRCFDFTVDPAETRHFEVHNDLPGGEPRTIGYWKNWNRCTGGGQAANAARNGGAAAGFFLVEDLLPQLIGDFSVTSCPQAVKLLSKQDQSGKNKASDAAYELSAQLLAARFNLAAGAETCSAVQQAVLDGQTLLDNRGFTGSGDYLGSKSKDPLRAKALSLAATLDRCNNGNLC